MKNLGEEFVWWYGVVEDRADPLELGRVRVRCYGWHTNNKGELPTEHLPWAQPIQPITSAASNEVGRSPTGIQIGSWVVGFFADGKEAQKPVIMGTIAGIPDAKTHDVDSRARGINNITKTPDSTINEPADPYAGKYPTNHTYKSESGHLIEIDDTEKAERIHVYHKSGTFIEIHKNGDVVTQHRNGWRSVTGNDQIHVTGNMNLIVDGDLNLKVSGNYYRTVAKESHIRFDGDKWEHIGADTYSRHEEGTDHSCPDDPSRDSADECEDVKEASLTFSENVKEA